MGNMGKGSWRAEENQLIMNTVHHCAAIKVMPADDNRLICLMSLFDAGTPSHKYTFASLQDAIVFMQKDILHTDSIEEVEEAYAKRSNEYGKSLTPERLKNSEWVVSNNALYLDADNYIIVIKPQVVRGKVRGKLEVVTNTRNKDSLGLDFADLEESFEFFQNNIDEMTHKLTFADIKEAYKNYKKIPMSR